MTVIKANNSSVNDNASQKSPKERKREASNQTQINNQLSILHPMKDYSQSKIPALPAQPQPEISNPADMSPLYP
jgi:hypothetical protein